MGVHTPFRVLCRLFRFPPPPPAATCRCRSFLSAASASRLTPHPSRLTLQLVSSHSLPSSVSARLLSDFDYEQGPKARVQACGLSAELACEWNTGVRCGILVLVVCYILLLYTGVVMEYYCCTAKYDTLRSP